MITIERAPIWILIIFVVIIVSGAVYGIKLDCKRSIFGLDFGTGESCHIRMNESSPEPIRLEKVTDIVERDHADKFFYQVEYCDNGTITSAIVGEPQNREAAICTCLDGEKGRGWYCLN